MTKRPNYIERAFALAKTDAELAKQLPDEAAYKTFYETDQPLPELLHTLFQAYGDRPALGERDYDIVSDKITGLKTRYYKRKYNSISFAQLLDRILCVSSAWQKPGPHRVKPDDFVCIMGFAGVDYVTIDTACAFAQAVTVPIQAAYGFDTLNGMLAEIEPKTIATTVEDLTMAVRLASANASVKSLIVFDYDGADEANVAAVENAQKALTEANAKLSLVLLEDLMALGDKDDWAFLPEHKDGSKRLAAIIHSSGSTGTPKGAMLTEGALIGHWRNSRIATPIIGIGLAPLNHLTGRVSLASTLSVGGVIYFTLAPDMSTLFEDIRLIRPTIVSVFPRILDLIYQDYLNEVAKCVRKKNMNEADAANHVMQDMRENYLGNRMLTGTVSGAPTTRAVRKFIQDCFGISFGDAYGNTEAGSGVILVNNRIQRPNVIDYKLRDVPELGYYTTDKPYPRGELCYKTQNQILGYYKQPEATANLFDEDGYSLTGDIVEERDADYLVLIDRRKDVLKLSQGEYVALGRLGTIFEAESDIIQQIYIYGNSLRSYLLAIIVPDQEALTAALGANPSETAINKCLRVELSQVGSRASLKSFEIPRNFIVEPEPFTQKNGLLSSVRKKLRPALKEKYAPKLEDIYEAGEQKRDAQLKALKDPDSKLSTVEKLRILLANNLGLEEGDIVDTLGFAALGGDSLGAVNFSLAVEEIFAAEIPTNDILSPANNITVWAKMIDDKDADQLPGFKAIHGHAPVTLNAVDLALGNFISPDDLKTGAQLTYTAKPCDDTVLLTGANGFLGRFVCLDWLKKLSQTDGKLVCLIRAADDNAARQRLEAVFAAGPADMQSDFKKLSSHLEVLAGDFGQVYLGLSQETFESLASRVDRICHVGALVNHVMDYKQFFKPNVAGTAELVRLAIKTRLKAFDFVSSVSANPFLEEPEDGDYRGFNVETTALKKETQLSEGYAAGYGLSKWAGETLLLQAHKAFGLPVNVFRGDMILAHADYAGQINLDDMFSRLLFSVIKTGVAPQSFYKTNRETPAKVPYDGIPVNVISESVTGVGQFYGSDYTVFNIENFLSHRSNNLDSFMDRIKAAGYPVEKLKHAEWLTRFEQKLKALPAEDKQQSALAILKAYEKPFSNWHFSLGHKNFRTLTEHLGVTADDMQLSVAYIEKCLSDLALKGLIDTPDIETVQAGKTVKAYGVIEEKAPIIELKISRRALGEKDVSVDIEYCGICHSDIHFAHNDWGTSRYPLVPGHEIIGRVSQIGDGVTAFKVGERVSVGCLTGSCQTCEPCESGEEQFCETGKVWTYNSLDYHNGDTLTMGGYSDKIVVNEDFVIGVPESLDPAGAAPLLCAGVTTWSPLRHWKVGPGMKVGIIGLGGLGHMAVKFASALGAQTVMITSSPEKTDDAKRLGADETLISSDRAAMKAARGSFDFLLDTVPVAHPVDVYATLLKRDATICLVGAIEPLKFHGGLIMGGRKNISGSVIGSIKETREMLAFCGEHNITADVEVIKPSEINKAWERVQKSDIKYRFVIDLKADV